MRKQTAWRVFLFAGTALIATNLGGCLHNGEIVQLHCGTYGTMETMIGGERHCVIAPLSCGDGTQEQATVGERECTPVAGADLLHCGTGTYELEQATVGERECVAGASPCAADQVAYVDANGGIACRPNVVCGDGTYEQATVGERECVPTGSVSGCGSGTQEQATVGERECVVPPGN